MDISELTRLLEELVKQPKESEWVEFKENYHSSEEIGKQISALANGASLNNDVLKFNTTNPSNPIFTHLSIIFSLVYIQHIIIDMIRQNEMQHEEAIHD